MSLASGGKKIWEELLLRGASGVALNSWRSAGSPAELGLVTVASIPAPAATVLLWHGQQQMLLLLKEKSGE